MHFYITGDTHRSFDRIEDFCYGYETTTEDVMIILGDAGINYWLDLSDKELKGRLSGMDITFFCVHGNHEARPCEAAEYEEKIKDSFYYMVIRMTVMRMLIIKAV